MVDEGKNLTRIYELNVGSPTNRRGILSQDNSSIKDYYCPTYKTSVLSLDLLSLGYDNRTVVGGTDVGDTHGGDTRRFLSMIDRKRPIFCRVGETTNHRREVTHKRLPVTTFYCYVEERWTKVHK